MAFLLSLALPQPAGASEADPPVSHSVELQLGSFFGGMDELVYEKGQSHEMSRLEWEENFVPYIDLRYKLEFRNFFSGVSLITGVPVKSGYMRDYDYLLADKNTASHFSQHDAVFDKHLEVYPEIGWGKNVGNWYFSGSVGFLYRKRQWSAVNGYTQYPPKGAYWSPEVIKVQQFGTIITYEESLWTPVLTLYSDYAINPQFKLGAMATWHPYLSINTTDTHILKLTRFEDKMKGGNGFLAEVNVLYSPKTSDIIGFRLAVGYEGIFPKRGASFKGGLGAGDWYGESTDIQSQLRSNLFWVALGFVIDPAKLFNLR